MLLNEAGGKGAEKYRVHNCRMVGTSVGLVQLPEAAVRRTMRLSQTSTALDKAYIPGRARLCDELGKEADRWQSGQRKGRRRAAAKAVGGLKKGGEVRAEVEGRGVGDAVLKGRGGGSAREVGLRRRSGGAPEAPRGAEGSEGRDRSGRREGARRGTEPLSPCDWRGGMSQGATRAGEKGRSEI
jgi:hypothetical protein